MTAHATSPRPSPSPAGDGEAMLLSIYTITPMHCGTGHVAGAVDLPIQREAHTGYPILPAQSLKGALRSHFEANGVKGIDHKDVCRIFGPELAGSSGGEPGEARGADAPERRRRDAPASGEPAEDRARPLQVGTVTFGEGQLLLYSIRSLSRLFLYVTSPLAIERLARNLRAFQVPGNLADACHSAARLVRDADANRDEEGRGRRRTQAREQLCWVADAALAGHTLVIEDLAWEASRVRHDERISTLAKQLSTLVRDDSVRVQIESNLVVIDDEELGLMARVVPVQARVKLNEHKTTGKNLDNKADKGNLWYEESLPPDCLFTAIMTARPNVTQRGQTVDGSPKDDLRKLRQPFKEERVVQIGGNETVGQGFCLLRDAGTGGRS